MNGFSYYHGTFPDRPPLGRQVVLQQPKQAGKTAKAKPVKKIKLGPADVRKHKVKVEVGFRQGTEIYETLELSLNELKAIARAHLSGDGSYPGAARKIAQFKSERQ